MCALVTSDSLSELEFNGCEGWEAVLRCPANMTLNILAAEFGRKLPSSVMCPYQHLPKYQSLPWDPMTENLNCVYSDALQVNMLPVYSDALQVTMLPVYRDTLQVTMLPVYSDALQVTMLPVQNVIKLIL